MTTTPQAFRTVAYPQETDQDVPLLLLIEHPDLNVPLRLTNAGGTQNPTTGEYTFTALGRVWTCAAIEIDPPGQSDEEPRARIRVPNVDQRIGQTIDAISTRATCTIWAVLENDPDVIVGGPHAYLLLQNVKGNALTLEGDLSRTSLTHEPWPKEWINAAKFKSAYRAVVR